MTYTPVFFGHLKSMKKCRENPGFQSTKKSAEYACALRAAHILRT